MFRTRPALVFSIIVALASLAHAQQHAYGLRGGFAAISSGEGNHAMITAFYDVPMGDVIFEPELVVLSAHAEEPAYGLAMKLRRQLRAGTWNLFADVGGQFVVWDTITTPGGPPKRAHVGIPLDLCASAPIWSSGEFELTLTYTPLFFLGAEPYRRSLLGALAGIRILVP